MRMPDLTVDMLAAVVALAKKKNLEPAGRELGLSPSAVHKRIRAADRIFEARLFIGTANGFELTDIGRVLHAHAPMPIEQLLLAEEITKAAARLHAKCIGVGHSMHLPARLLALLYSPSLPSSLGARIEHKAGLSLALAEEVVQGTLHAALGFLPINHPGLIVYQITEEPIVVCMPKGHALAIKPNIRPRDLIGQPIIATSRNTFPVLHQQIDELFEEYGIKLNVIADAFGPHEATVMVEHKVGLCLVASSSAPGTIVSRPLVPQTLKRRCGLVVREDNRHPLLKSFVNHVLEKAAR